MNRLTESSFPFFAITHFSGYGLLQLSFQEWTQQMRDMLEARKRGDLAFRDKDFKAAIEYYSQVLASFLLFFTLVMACHRMSKFLMHIFKKTDSASNALLDNIIDVGILRSSIVQLILSYFGCLCLEIGLRILICWGCIVQVIFYPGLHLCSCKMYLEQFLLLILQPYNLRGFMHELCFPLTILRLHSIVKSLVRERRYRWKL